MQTPDRSLIMPNRVVHEERINDLFKVIAQRTEDLAEQAVIVALCEIAGHDAEWLAARLAG